jgi:membrane protein YdbS with pleckstrin-like domain
MTQKKDTQQVMREFRVRQSRQFIAIAIALFIVLLCAVIYKRPELFGEYSKTTLFGAQAIIIVSYVVFTSWNWICPSCGKYLGADINRRICKKCRARLQ